MIIITEVRTYLGGLLNSTGREPVELPDDTNVDDPSAPSRWIEVPDSGDDMRVEAWVGNGIAQKL
jgi:hypothetical protein